jgi:peptidoglycan/xylan/chitin deacetylase (PgdA/CDA1 family)
MTDLGGDQASAGAQLALTFDVDAESVWLSGSPSYERRLSTLSEARYGVGRGLERILALLERHGATATFYVPGATADRHPDAVRQIVAGGHVIGHHGHDHLKSHTVGADVQRQEIERGLEALDALGVRPDGYRSPAWELTPETLGLLGETGFVWDSSLMEDDRPYRLELEGRTLVELPVHWTLDDWPWFGWTEDGGGNLTDAAVVARVWEDELRSAVREQRLLTITMHPEVIGRPHRVVALERVMEAAVEAGVPLVSHELAARGVADARR